MASDTGQVREQGLIPHLNFVFGNPDSINTVFPSTSSHHRIYTKTVDKQRQMAFSGTVIDI
ncbi:hypothetical protein [Leptodesmis sp.]|uniref:hypothetical protein n=1 Tax=Leptodesmis sp. TaxID=3100501 RepID=UPI0040534DEF